VPQVKLDYSGSDRSQRPA